MIAMQCDARKCSKSCAFPASHQCEPGLNLLLKKSGCCYQGQDKGWAGGAATTGKAPSHGDGGGVLVESCAPHACSRSVAGNQQVLWLAPTRPISASAAITKQSVGMKTPCQSWAAGERSYTSIAHHNALAV